jgi:hypothetical protein
MRSGARERSPTTAVYAGRSGNRLVDAPIVEQPNQVLPRDVQLGRLRRRHLAADRDTRVIESTRAMTSATRSKT